MRDIFVFGSNLAGIHGAGSALHAKRFYGAVDGVGEGLTGAAYAIPTKSAKLNTLALSQIKIHVDKFLEFARAHADMRFNLVEIGCGLAGYKPEDIAPLFTCIPLNVIMPQAFHDVIGKRMLATAMKELDLFQ
jgi:hypothetical protein